MALLPRSWASIKERELSTILAVFVSIRHVVVMKAKSLSAGALQHPSDIAPGATATGWWTPHEHAIEDDHANQETEQDAGPAWKNSA